LADTIETTLNPVSTELSLREGKADANLWIADGRDAATLGAAIDDS
jgi:hypothetical protein